ncbi:hypothetical protein HDU90_005069 [Geranomyces variabilis]|nr:hypothetical protein HDU90_005069 [Geranomyces variabilis]
MSNNNNNKQGTADKLSVFDDSIPTLPSPAVLATTECDELEESISFGPPVDETQTELPLETWEESQAASTCQSTTMLSDARFYAENMLSPSLRLRSKIFKMHGCKECTRGGQQQHLRANERGWKIEEQVLDRLSPLEERDLIFYLSRFGPHAVFVHTAMKVANDTETCMFYDHAEYGIRIISPDPVRIDQAIIRLNSLHDYLLEMKLRVRSTATLHFQIQLPIPKYDSRDKRAQIPEWPSQEA